MPNLFIKTIASLAIWACCGLSAQAGPVTWAVTVDTSSISGAAGSLDLNFNPGPLVTQSATLQVTGFASDGSLTGSCACMGDVTGQLPGSVTFDNGTGLNDYFQGFTFGTALSFNLTFSGPALTAPDGAFTSGSTFAFSLFSDSDGASPVLTSDTTDGFAFLIDVNTDGSTTPTNFSSVTALQQTPEPGSWLLVTPLAAWLLRRGRRQSGASACSSSR